MRSDEQMDEATLAGIEQRHRPVDRQVGSKTHGYATVCAADGQRWPCEVRRLSVALAEQQKQTEVYRNQADDYGRRYGVAFVGAIAKNERAEAAEAALADLRAELLSLADSVDHPPCGTTGRRNRLGLTDRLRALAAAPSAEWRCSHTPRCADSACSDNPAMQRWIARSAAAPSGEPDTEENR